MMGEYRNKLSKKDITKLGIISTAYQTGFNYERMQAGGFTASMIPSFKKIYGDNKEEISKAMTNNMDFINTEPHMGTFLMGLIVSLEEAGEDRNLIKNLKVGLFGPLAGLGDAIFWFTLLPISAGICSSLAQEGSIVGPILYMLIWFIAWYSRVWFAGFGYSLGVNAISTIRKNAGAITKAAGILGVMVVGGLLPNYVSINILSSIPLAKGSSLSIQKDFFDKILPNLLPLGFVFFTYWLLKNKRVNIVLLIVSIILVSILCSALGIL